MRIGKGLLVSVLLAVSPTANAQDADRPFSARFGLTGLYYAESQSAGAPEQSQAAPVHLGWLELRTVLDGRNLGAGSARKLDLHLDFRLRLTSDYSVDTGITGGDQLLSRGYLGGREYDLREAWARLRDARFDFAIGRQVIVEADATRIDGARFAARLTDHLELGVFGGGYPDPASRSLLTDYSSCAPVAVAGATQSCNATAALLGGASFGWTFPRAWGAIAAASSYLGGKDDGGPFDPMNPAGNPLREPPRTFVTLRGFERLYGDDRTGLDLFHDLVLDATGDAGVELTRFMAQLSFRTGRFALRAGYDRFSPLAIEMYLTRLLAARTLYAGLTVENNLIVERTARQQGRLDADVTFGRATIYAEGRVRYRSLVDAKDDPQFVNAAGDPLAPQLAYESTVGIRDRGTLAGLRLGASGTYLHDFRATSYLLRAAVGRDFADDRFGFDLEGLYAHSSDEQSGQTCDPTSATTTFATCFGGLRGDQFQVSATVTANPTDRLLFLVDYRLVFDAGDNAPLLLTHILLARIELRI